MRYDKQIKLQEVGRKGQERLVTANVLVIGAGGLGCPVLIYLAAAGVGHIGIVDYDVVEESNLPRQPLYKTLDIGKPKAEVAASILRQMNSDSKIEIFPVKLTEENASGIIDKFDIIADCTDNFIARYLINDTCVILDKPWVFGSIEGWQGQVSALNIKERTGKRGPTYRCLFPEAPAPEDAPSCDDFGIIGTVAGIVGNLQANEIIKWITEAGTTLNGVLLTADLLTNQFTRVEFQRNEFAVRKLKTDKESEKTAHILLEKRAAELARLAEKKQKLADAPALDEAKEPEFKQTHIPVPHRMGPRHSLEVTLDEYLNNPALALIDIRETWEYDDDPSGSMNIPFNELMRNLAQLNTSKDYLLMCAEGRKGLFLAYHIKNKYGLTNVFSLEGGWNKLKEHMAEKV